MSQSTYVKATIGLTVVAYTSGSRRLANHFGVFLPGKNKVFQGREAIEAITRPIDNGAGEYYRVFPPDEQEFVERVLGKYLIDFHLYATSLDIGDNVILQIKLYD